MKLNNHKIINIAVLELPKIYSALDEIAEFERK